MNSEAKLIKITHITDPSRFYCRDVSLEDDEAEQILEIEEKLLEFASNRREGWKSVKGIEDDLKRGDVSES